MSVLAVAALFRLRSSSLSEKAFYGIARFIDELRGRVSIQNCSGRGDFQGRICPRAEFLEKEVKRNRFARTLKLPLLAVDVPAARCCETWLKMPGTHTAAQPDAVALRTKMMIHSLAHLYPMGCGFILTIKQADAFVAHSGLAAHCAASPAASSAENCRSRLARSIHGLCSEPSFNVVTRD